MSDMVDHPEHYDENTIDIIERIIEGLDSKSAARLFNVLKYAIRAGKKGDLDQDIAKANNFAHRLCTGEWRWQHETEAKR